MAKFKISLLSTQPDNSTDNFIPSVLSNFTSQILEKESKTYSTSSCYTYDEKLSLHQNAQKELTFSMDRMLLQHDEWRPNPFAAAIHVGSLLELKDKFDNTYLFIVKKIAFTFKQHNITYQYTCQDAFSYQYTRQQNGYTIENDSSSEDFIGPHTIDWWVIHRIKPECYIEYQYTALQDGLCLETTIDTSGKTITQVKTFTEEERDTWVGDNVKRKILKEPYTSIYKDDSGEIKDEFQTPIIFSCNNSNANAALISLGDNLSLMLHTCEFYINNHYEKYFWYEPKQNTDVTGLQYSPDKNINSFGLSFEGDSLTTVLNVTGGEIGDDKITLLPSPSSFFLSCFADNDWDNSQYEAGYFTSLMSGIKVTNVISSGEADFTTEVIETPLVYKHGKETDYLVGVKLMNSGEKFKLPNRYNRFRAQWTDTYSSFTIDDFIFNSYQNTSYLYIKDGKQINGVSTDILIKEGDEIPSELLNKEVECYLVIHWTNASKVTISTDKIYLNFYRQFSTDEKEFAKIADTCPWLENRLIDFSYFLKQGIITRQEFQSIMSILQNDLRIVNGKLLYYNASYYAALKEKVKTISNLTNSLDALGAAFEADVVTPIRENGTITDISSFRSAYDTVFKAENPQPIAILNYSELVKEYFENYMSAEQRFLKNMYNFRTYFEEPCSFAGADDACVYQDKLAAQVNIPTTDTPSYFVSFEAPVFKQWNGADGGQVFYYDNHTYTTANIITLENCTNYYKPSVLQNSFVQIHDDSNADLTTYNSNNSYYLSATDYNTIFKNILRENAAENNYKDDNGTVYYKLSHSELTRLALNTSNGLYYIRNTEQYTPLDWVRVPMAAVKNAISWTLLPNILQYCSDNFLDPSLKDISTWGNNNFFDNYYKAFYPLSNVYYYGPVINYTVETKEDEDTGKTTTLYSFYRVNKSGENLKKLIEKYETEDNIPQSERPEAYQTYQLIPFIGNGGTLVDWGLCSNDAAVAAKNKIDSAWKYYTLNYSPTAGQVTARVFESITIATLSSLFLGPLGGLLTGAGVSTFLSYNDDNFYHWQNNNKPQRCFDGEGSQSHKSIQSLESETAGLYAKTATSGSDYQKLMKVWLETIKNNNTSLVVPEWLKNYPLDDNIKVEKDSTITTDLSLEQYFDYYKHLAISYNYKLQDNGSIDFTKYGTVTNNLWVKNKYYRPLTSTSIINRTDKYVRILISQTTSDNEASKVTLNERKNWKYLKSCYAWLFPKFSTITLYPLTTNAEEVKLSSVDDIWGENDTVTLAALVNKLQDASVTIEDRASDDDNNVKYAVVKVDKASTSGEKATLEYIYCHVEEYEHQSIITSDPTVTYTEYTNPDQFYYYPLWTQAAPDMVYSEETDQIVDVLQVPGMLGKIAKDGVNLYMIAASNMAMVQLTDEDKEYQDNSNKDKGRVFDNLCCYRSLNDSYVRIYSATQIKNALNKDESYCTQTEARKYKVLQNTVYTQTNFSKSITSFTPQLYLCSMSKNDKGNYSIESKRYQAIQLDFDAQFSGDKKTGSITKTITDENGIQYDMNITLEGQKLDDIQGLTNGSFWYKYHEKIEWPTLFEAAAAIETQLQTYWDQAYTASKYCKYFLPEYWQPGTQAVKNGFASQIIIKTDSNGGIALSDYYIPTVKIYANEHFKHLSYEHYLPKYQWYLKSSLGEMSLDELNHNSYITSGDEYISADAVEILHNEAISQILKDCGSTLSDWYVIENGYTVYYYTVGGGMLWSDLANAKCGASSFDNLNGLYGMMYYLLTHNYTLRDMSTYTELKAKKERIWHKIYDNYPFLMLEDNYTYSDATSSTELLNMAQLVFKGKKEPERSYNISLIDIYSLQGYNGQELYPGQGILLRGEDYYNENDEISTALKQYLYISDVSYTLRSDADVSVTVNNIKYQEKLLQSLVKLIR